MITRVLRYKRKFAVLFGLVMVGLLFYSFYDPQKILDVVLVSLAVNLIAAYVFYLLFIYMPKKKRLASIKRNFHRNFHYFKKNMIWIFLKAVDKGEEKELIERLRDIREFRVFFEESFDEGRNRWDMVENKLVSDSELKQNIFLELNVLRDEVVYILDSIQINDDDVFFFLKVLSENVYRIEEREHNQDEVKALMFFLWQVFAGWSNTTGYSERDIIDVMVDKLDDNYV